LAKWQADIEETFHVLEEALTEIEGKEVRKRRRKKLAALVRNVPRRNRPNITEEQRKGLINVTRKDIVVEQGDKGGAVIDK